MFAKFEFAKSELYYTQKSQSGPRNWFIKPEGSLNPSSLNPNCTVLI